MLWDDLALVEHILIHPRGIVLKSYVGSVGSELQKTGVLQIMQFLHLPFLDSYDSKSCRLSAEGCKIKLAQPKAACVPI